MQPKLLNDTGGYVLVNGTGHTRTFNCSADGIPRPNILWRRNGFLILNSTRVEIINSPVPDASRSIRVNSIPDIQEAISIMTITNMKESDNGNYSCRADNSAGEADILDDPFRVNVTYGEYG